MSQCIMSNDCQCKMSLKQFTKSASHVIIFLNSINFYYLIDYSLTIDVVLFRYKNIL